MPLVIDNTLASPYLCRPFEHGADLVVHSLTKYLGGHGTTMGGILVESGKFPWDNGQVSPDDRAVARLPRRDLPRDVRRLRLHDEGAHGDDAHARPDAVAASAFLLLQGIETLHLRMPRHCESALAVAQHGRRILRSNGSTIRCCRTIRSAPLQSVTCRAAPGGILTFGVKGGAAAGERFIEAVQFLSHLANVGDAKSLIIHPASTTHRQLDENEQRAAGVLPEMIRLSIGLESLDDILWDLDQALAKSQA